MRSQTGWFLFLICPFVGIGLCFGDETWGDLKLRIVLAGKPPNLAPIPIPGQAPIPNQQLVINRTNQGIANIVLRLHRRSEQSFRIHPNLIDAPIDPLECVAEKGTFTPHVGFLRPGQRFILNNAGSDYIQPIFDSYGTKEESKRPLLPNEYLEKTFDRPNDRIVLLDCGIYPWMRAYLIPSTHPYVGISNEEGVIEIRKLPAGTPLPFQFLHESFYRGNLVLKNQTDGVKETWEKRCKTLTLKEGMNDLGTWEIQLDQFRVP
jgi:hypothetical protein